MQHTLQPTPIMPEISRFYGIIIRMRYNDHPLLLSVVAVRVIGEYRLRLTFNNGIVNEIDFAKHWGKLSDPIFQPLRDRVFFSQVTLPLDSETIEWPNGADLAAEFLYEIGEPVTTAQTTVMVA